MQTRYKKDIFYNEDGETLAEVAQRDSRCPVPGSTQDQVGRGSEQPNLSKMSLLIAGGLD